MKVVADLDTEALPSAIAEFSEAKKILKGHLAEHGTASVFDPAARDVIQKVADGDPLPADRIIARLEERIGGSFSVGEFSEAELEDLGMGLFYSWFSDREYVEGLLEASSIILGISVPEGLRRLVSEARDCFAFQQYNAVCAMSRTMVEWAARDILQRTRRPQSHRRSGVVDLWSRSPRGLIRAAAGSAVQVAEELEGIYQATSSVIHGERQVDKEFAKSILARSLRGINSLYRARGF